MWRSRGLVILSVCALALTGVALGSAPSVAATNPPALTPTSPMAGETVRITGAVPTKVKRPVTVQRKTGSGWVAQVSGKTTAQGRYALTSRFTAGTTIRTVARKVTVNGKRYAAWTSKTRLVEVAAQSVALALAPSAETGSPVTVTATSRPVRVGRTVLLQVLTGDTWTTVGTETENASGVTTYTVTPAAAGTFSYRAVALAWRGAAARPSATVALTVTDPVPPSALQLVSVALDGGPANGASSVPRVSGDGRYVVFASHATNLVAGDTEGVGDVFLRDLQTGTTVRVSQTPAGAGGNQTSWNPDVSDDGRYVAYRSSASNLGWSGSNKNDVLLWDRETGETVPVSPQLSPEDIQGGLQGAPDGPRISGDGSTVAWVSDDTLAGDDGDLADDAFVWDRATQEITWISHGAETDPGVYAGSADDIQSVGAMSDDGTRVPFVTAATLASGTNPGPGAGLSNPDVYIWEGFGDEEVVTLATINASNERHTSSESPALSGDGEHLAFQSGEEEFTGTTADGTLDVFTWDVDTGYHQVSTSPFPAERETSDAPAISQDGTTVVFHSRDEFLVDETSSTTWDVFRWVSGEGLELISHDSGGGPTNGQSTAPDVSADGSVVVFQSVATDIVVGDTNATSDVFVYAG